MRRKTRTAIGALATLGVALAHGCGGGGGGGDPVVAGSAPSSVTLVSEGSFQAPMDAVASPDGERFYFSGFTMDDERRAAVFAVSAGGGDAEPLHAGAPLAYPTGLVLSCDGQTLFVADMRSAPESDEPADAADDGGALYTIATSGGAPTRLSADGIGVPTGLALSVDCTTLYVSGWTESGAPALFTVPIEGGAATVVHEGAPLVSPTGLHVDADRVAWVMDHLAVGDDGPGVLFAIPPTGGPTAVVSDLEMGAPGGVSLTSVGGTAVIPTRDEDGQGRLIAIEIATGVRSELTTPAITDPAGLRTARGAAVFAVVDHEGGRIFRAE